MSVVKTLLGEAKSTATPHQPTSAIPKSDTWSAIKYVYDNSQPLDAELSAIAGLTSAADRLPYFTGSGTASLATFTAFGRSILDDADEATFKATVNLEIGTDVQAYDAELAALAGLTSAADKLPYFTGSGTAALATFTAFGRSIVDDADEATFKATVNLEIGVDVQAYDAELAALAGLTSAADKVPYFTGSGTAAVADFTAAGRALVDDADASAQRTTLGLVIGTNVQAYDAELAALAGLTSAADKVPYFTGSGTAAVADFSSFGRSLVDDADASAARTTLALGNLATSSTSTVLAWTGQQTFTEATLTDGANIAWALNTQQAAKVTLGGNRTLDAATNQVAGGVYVLRIIQDGTGSRTLSFNANYLFPNGTDPTLSTGASDKDVLVCTSDGTNMFCVINQDFS
jgi:hypothetical protein